MTNDKLRSLWEAFELSKRLVDQFTKEHGRAPTDVEERVAISIWIEANRATPKGANGNGNSPAPDCPQCGGPMHDNRGRKQNPKQPDFRCKDQNCTDESGYRTAIFRAGEKPKPQPQPQRRPTPAPQPAGSPFDADDDDLPF